jgi:exosortase/archaeosortase family protein
MSGGADSVQPLPESGTGVIVAQLAILLGLCAAVFFPQLSRIVAGVGDSEAAHALAAPVIIVVLCFFRWPALCAARSRGSAWGVVGVLAALLLYAAATWPFNFEYPRRVAVVVAMTGVVLAVFGWGVLKLSLPMLLALLLAVPVGMRIYAFLIIRPETITLSVVQITLDMLPGVFVNLEGTDLSYFGSRGSGTIALGEPMRGAQLFLSSLLIGVLVIFARIRPWWQLILLGAATIPIVLFCNYFRLVFWGLITIFGGVHPASAAPRTIASLSSLLLAYAIFALAVVIASKIVEQRTETGVTT